MLRWVSFAACATLVCSDGTMKLVKLPTAKCIDGSPATYYIAANSSSKGYIIFLEGGGVCTHLKDCKLRAKTDLGSSKNLRPEMPDNIGGVIGSDDTNPDFRSWNRIYVPYCSGDIWTGTMTEAVNPFDSTEDWRGFFSGHNIVKEVIADLKNTYGAGQATNAILSGCSAGGIGTFANCDFFAEAFPDAKTACRPESGYFGLPFKSYDAWVHGQNVSDADMHHESATSWMGGISRLNVAAQEACNKSSVTGHGHNFPYCQGIGHGCCEKIPYYYPFTKTPMFIAQNTMDSYQIGVQGKGHEWDKDFNGYLTYVQEIMAGWLTLTAVNGPKSGSDGMFTTACHEHCKTANTAWTSSGAIIDGLTGAQAFGDWYFERTASHMHLDNSSSPRCGKASESIVV